MIAKSFRLLLILYALSMPLLQAQQPYINQLGIANVGDTATLKDGALPPIAQKLNAIPPEMVAIGGGTFSMGCTQEQDQAIQLLGYPLGCSTSTPVNFSTATPAHESTIPNFLLGKYEVTQSDWIGIMGSNPSFFTACGGNCPVDRVTWFGAAVFCNRLSEMSGLTACYYSDAPMTQVLGKNGNAWSVPSSGNVFWNTNANGYRLPTETEWEYAARGGLFSNIYQFAGGNNVNLVAWYTTNSSVVYTPNIGGHGTNPVGLKTANELGLFDMSGNVFEWCYDWFQTSYTGLPGCMPTGAGNGTFRVMRGGSWASSTELTLLATRNWLAPGSSGNNLGFRLARTP